MKIAIAEELNRREEPFSLIAETSPQGMELILSGPSPTALRAALSRVGASGQVDVRRGAVAEAQGKPAATHSYSQQQPGLRIYVKDPPSNPPAGLNAFILCTWGVNGHTNSYNYLVTAGHCLTAHENYVGQLGNPFDVFQNSAQTRKLTVTTPWVISETSSSPSSGKTDATRIQSNYANDNCYHGAYYLSGGGHCRYPIRYRASHNSWEINADTTCASLGRSNTWRCGYILEENAVSAAVSRLVRNSITTQIGDSGSGMLGGSDTIDGIHVAGVNGYAHFVTAYDVKRRLGFDFNCANGQATKAANQWGACPIINR